MDRAIYLLLLLYADNQKPIMGNLKLQKLTFLIQKEVIEKGKRVSDENYNFLPYRFGPFTPAIYDEIETLKQYGLVEVKETRRGTHYMLSPKGKKLIETLLLKKVIPVSLLKAIEKIKKKYSTMDLNKLIRLIYANYPEFAQRSEWVIESI